MRVDKTNGRGSAVVGCQVPGETLSADHACARVYGSARDRHKAGPLAYGGMAMDQRPAPWERQPGESNKAYTAFCIYRDLPPTQRSLKEVTIRFYEKDRAKVRRASKMIEKWSVRWRWVERAEAWDQERDRRAREAEIEAVKKRRQEMVDALTLMLQKGVAALKQTDPRWINPANQWRYVSEAVKLLLQIDGEATDKQRGEEAIRSLVEALQQSRRESEQEDDEE